MLRDQLYQGSVISGIGYIRNQGVPVRNQVQRDVKSDLGSNIVEGYKEDGRLHSLQTGSVTGRHQPLSHLQTKQLLRSPCATSTYL